MNIYTGIVQGNGYINSASSNIQLPNLFSPIIQVTSRMNADWSQQSAAAFEKWNNDSENFAFEWREAKNEGDLFWIWIDISVFAETWIFFLVGSPLPRSSTRDEFKSEFK